MSLAQLLLIELKEFLGNSTELYLEGELQQSKSNRLYQLIKLSQWEDKDEDI